MNKSLNRADAEYYRLLLEIMGQGNNKNDRTGTGTKSVFGRQIRFDMKDGFPLLTTKKIHFKSVVHELLWFLSGNTNTKYLNENGVTIWDEWADENGDLGPVYGKQWVNWETYFDKSNDWLPNSYNQIQNAIDTLKNNPDDRGNIVSAWNVGELNQMALRPCHNFFQFYTRELSAEERLNYYDDADHGQPIKLVGLIVHEDSDNQHIHDWLDDWAPFVPKRAISLMWNQRSVDTFLGLPFNIASYGLLLHMIAQQVNMVPDQLVGTLGDTHIYSNHIDYVKEQMTRGSKAEQPTLKLNKAKDIFSYKFEDFEICDYDSHPNWKSIPIAV